MAKMGMKMAMKKFEGSSKDMKSDKAGAKKAGMSMKKYEGSPADEKKDKKGAMALMKKSKK
jgi:hypothetical protein